jgi:hypothetical protein
MSHHSDTIAILSGKKMLQFCQWLYNSGIGTSIRQSIWIFPIIETVHVLGITLLAGTVSLLDLRLLGLIFKRQSVAHVASQVLPLTWAGFAVMFVSGFLLFSAEAVDCYGNTPFRIKLLFILLAGFNALVFHRNPITPLRARLAGGFSLTLWTGIICAGRAIAYISK